MWCSPNATDTVLSDVAPGRLCGRSDVVSTVWWALVAGFTRSCGAQCVQHVGEDVGGGLAAVGPGGPDSREYDAEEDQQEDEAGQAQPDLDAVHQHGEGDVEGVAEGMHGPGSLQRFVGVKDR